MSGCLLAIAYILACLPYRAEAIGQIRWEYHDYAMLHQELDDFRLRWPQLSRVYTIGTSVKGREMYVLEISDNPGVHEVGKLLIFWRKIRSKYNDELKNGQKKSNDT